MPTAIAVARRHSRQTTATSRRATQASTTWDGAMVRMTAELRLKPEDDEGNARSVHSASIDLPPRVPVITA
jgi:hypothetical protein